MEACNHLEECEFCKERDRDIRERAEKAIREQARIIHFGRFHQWEDFEKCTEKECVEARDLLAALRKL